MANNFDIVISGKDESSAAFATLNANIARAAAQLAAMQAPIAQVGGLVDKFKTSIVAIGGALAIDKIAAWLSELQKSTADIKAQSDVLGLTTDQLQAYKLAAIASGQP